MEDTASSWDRRQVLTLAGISAVGTLALGQTGAVAQEDANVSVRFNDQESDGSSVVVESLYTEVEAEIIIFHSEGDRQRYKVLNVEAGTEFSNHTIELDESIPETQLISISIQPPEGGYSYGGARATVAVDEPLNEPDADGAEATVELIEADPDAGFNWPYLLYTPSTSNSTTESNDTDTRPLIVGNSPWRGVPSETERRLESGRGHIENGRLNEIATEVNSPALVALIPSRGEDGSYENLSLSGSDPPRLDLQVLAMVEDARTRLSDQPYDIPEKFHAEGFSSNGRFYDKFTVLHPERINAFSAGGNGIAVLPLEELSEDIPTAGDPSTTTLPWPVGVGDLPDLIGTEFNKNAWLETNQFWYIGAEDQDPENPEEYVHKLYRGSGEVDTLISEVFGSLQVDDRFRTSQAIFEQLGVSAEFTAYEGAGHELTDAMIEDVVDFHRRQKHEEFGPQFSRTIEWPSGTFTVEETFTISVSYENLGAAEATASPTLLVDGETVDTAEVTIAPGEVDRTEFEYSFTSPGEYTVSVDGVESESFEVTAADDNTDASEDQGSTEDSSTQAEPTTVDQPGFGIVQALTALGGIGYLLKRWGVDNNN
jgi:hypothetical protein